MVIVRTKLVRLLRASAVTAYPFIFADPDLLEMGHTLRFHEPVHWRSQRDWYKRAWVFGLLAWWGLYLLALPVGWNRWRKRWETEAMVAEGKSPEKIAVALRQAPYYLWFS